MWNALRLHPWRLEIVPAAAFGSAVWGFCVYKSDLEYILTGDTHLRNPDLAGLPCFLLMMTLMFCLLEFGWNQSWVRMERRKKFNWHALMLQVPIIMQAWLLYALVFLVKWRIWHVGPLPDVFRQLALILLVAVGITAVLEWSRRYVPREEEPEPPLLAVSAPGEYTEAATDWSTLPSALAMMGAGGIGVVSGISTHLDRVLTMSAGVLAGCLFVSLSRSTLTVTATAITHRWGFFATRVRVSDVDSCIVGDRETQPKRSKDVKIVSRRKRGGRFVEIRTRDGRIYRLGAIRPTHVCALIEKAKKDLPPTPSAAEAE